jgi:uncharacterized protein (TIGR02246 family)
MAHMNEAHDRQQIRDLISTWLRASAEDDLDTVLSLMAEDVVFLRPGQPPMRGRDSYAAASKAMAGKIKIEGHPDIQEIQIAGDFACCWNHLSITITPANGGAPMQHAGPVLSVFRKQPDGRWLLSRDANMLTEGGFAATSNTQHPTSNV